ncbi:uncharacterized protein LOC120845433 [Ixodes scapularis]|uniref:uncharacterized protein LOC120845433 n=1 Tax=Ixodes scapularis TaxID=6945 RepID=UPI001C3902C1|nr:uncharacterized protein LOC120845433 [Ixodes scapularis]
MSVFSCVDLVNKFKNAKDTYQKHKNKITCSMKNFTQTWSLIKRKDEQSSYVSHVFVVIQRFIIVVLKTAVAPPPPAVVNPAVVPPAVVPAPAVPPAAVDIWGVEGILGTMTARWSRLLTAFCQTLRSKTAQCHIQADPTCRTLLAPA